MGVAVERRQRCSSARSMVLVVAQAALLGALVFGYSCQMTEARTVTNEQELSDAIASTETAKKAVNVVIAGNIVLTKALPPIIGKIVITGGPNCKGGKCVVDGAGKFAIFVSYHSAPQCSVEVKNLVLQNAADSAIDGKCNLRLSRVDFKNNKGHAGAAVGIGLGSATWHIEHCLFESNEAATSGGALLVTSNGRGHIISTTFKSNSAAGEGGAVFISSLAEHYLFSHVTFESNTAGGNGGGIYVTPHNSSPQTPTKVFISHCKFTKNAATGGNGGGIALSTLLDARICNTALADGQNTAKGGKGNDLALIRLNYGVRMAVSFCPARPKTLSLFSDPVVTNPGGTTKPDIRVNCDACKLPK